MTLPNDATAIEGLQRFLTVHASCGRTALDTPGLPGGNGYRALVACRCGDTAEYWLTDALLPRQHLVTALARRPAA